MSVGPRSGTLARMSRPRPLEIDRRDPEFIRAWMGAFALAFEHYHTVEVRGLEAVAPGAALVVGNHNGGIMAPDMFALMVRYWQHFGPEARAYGLMHDFIFRVPAMGSTMARLGAVPAKPENALALLGTGAKVLVYPGGDLDAFKPSSRRNEVVFGSRVGFIRVALRSGAPIVPVVSAGAHEGFHVITDGVEFARRSGWKKLTRIEVFPVVLALPFGLWLGPIGLYLPWPVHMKLRVLDPIRWPELGPDAADDPGVLARCQEEVRLKMQEALDEMVKEGGFGRRMGGSARAGQ